MACGGQREELAAKKGPGEERGGASRKGSGAKCRNCCLAGEGAGEERRGEGGG